MSVLVMRKKITRFNLLLISICALTWAGCSSSIEEENNDLSSNSDSAPVEQARQGIEFFQGSFTDALAQAETEDKDVFVFFKLDYGSWRPSCLVMREVVFQVSKVGEYFNKRFVKFEVDFDKGFPHWVDIYVHKEFDLAFWPTYLILDSKGNSLGYAQGRASPSQLISVISRVIGESESNFDTWQDRYDSGERSPEFVQQFLMKAIEELVYGKHKSEGIAKYKEIAEAYFDSKPDAELINETDAHLIMYFYEPPVRGDKLVEFVLEHYDEFLAVSSETAMSQFTLHATTNAIEVAAQAGDEKFVEYVEALETYPLKQAVDHERTRVPRSHHFPEFIKSHWGVDYHKVRGEWDHVYEILQAVLDEQAEERVWPRYWTHSTVAAELLQSNNPAHREKAVSYGKTLYESNDQDPSYAAVYVAALQASGKKYSAIQVSEQYRKRMSRFGRRMQLNTYESSLSSLLDRINETATSEE
ncbi:MAG: DUF255 domain-containing protein [Gammaproteobacteria bacterium]|nr:DUF255 domain-containing protein [Gammaproteobacteria bacterium]MYF37589.1 DUF255 domain-containing protein [Gammaproteobacteria bacterium]